MKLQYISKTSTDARRVSPLYEAINEFCDRFSIQETIGSLVQPDDVPTARRMYIICFHPKPQHAAQVLLPKVSVGLSPPDDDHGLCRWPANIRHIQRGRSTRLGIQ